jgi:hypothetical protein
MVTGTKPDVERKVLFGQRIVALLIDGKIISFNSRALFLPIKPSP